MEAEGNEYQLNDNVLGVIRHRLNGNDTLHFFYDTQDRPAKVEFNGAVYTDVHSFQGDVMGLIDVVGKLMVEYKYDAWAQSKSIVGMPADS